MDTLYSNKQTNKNIYIYFNLKDCIIQSLQPVDSK